MQYLLLILKNLRRNKLRSALTGLAVFCLVVIFCMIHSVLRFLDAAKAEKSSNIPLVVTERYRLPSRFDRSHLMRIVSEGTPLNQKLRTLPGFQPDQYTLWHFIVFSLDPELKDKDLQFFAIATLPDKMLAMVDGLEGIDQRVCDLMKNPPGDGKPHTGVVMGADRLKRLGKKVGDKFPAKSFSHREGKSGLRQPFDMEFVIVGELPAGSRWAQGAFMDYEYLDLRLREEKCDLDGKINLGWMRVADKETAGQVAALIEAEISEVKCEQASSAVSRFLEGYEDLFTIVKWVLRPAILAVMAIIVANAIGITVRERMNEMAVLKVLGFSPLQIQVLVLGEGLIVGLFSAFISAAATYVLINEVMGGINLPVAFFPVFSVPLEVLVLGPVLGVVTALAGGFVPAWNARRVRVSEVFAKVA